MFESFGSVVIAILMLSVLVLVHEAGHYAMAKLFHFPVYEFAIGFGPRLLKRKIKGTLFSLRALPLGGFVAFESQENVENDTLQFGKRPAWQRFLVILAGPMTNILLAILIAFLALAVVGMPVSTTGVGSFQDVSPAYEAGLRAGDEIIAIDGQAVGGSVDTMLELTQRGDGSPLTLTVLRDGREMTYTVQPFQDEVSGRWMVGINLAQRAHRLGVGESVKGAFIWVAAMIAELFAFLMGLFTKGQGAGDFVGVVGAVSVISQEVQTMGLAYFMARAAFLSINFGVFNLLPLPALDGSKLVLLVVEMVRRKALPIKAEGIIQMVGLVAFGLLFLLLTYRDILRIVTGG